MGLTEYKQEVIIHLLRKTTMRTAEEILKEEKSA